jgi:hypothetical protein
VSNATRLSHRTSFGKITSEGRRPDASGRPSVRTNVQVGRPPTDSMSGRPIGRPGGRPPDGMPSATPSGGRHGGRPSDHRSPAPAVGWMVDGRSVRRSGWRSAGRLDGLADPSAWAIRQGPSSRGRPPEAVRQGPSARDHPPSRNFGGP